MAARSTELSPAQVAVNLLGVVPYFDIATGKEIVQLVESELDRDASDQWVDDFFIDLLVSGSLERVRNLHRVAAPVREQALEIARQNYPELAIKTVDIFVRRSEAELGLAIAAVLGYRARTVLIQAIDSASHPADQVKFDSLIETVHRSKRLGRGTDSQSALELLRAYGAADRQLAFMEGLAHWQAGERAEAARHFRHVLEFDTVDKAEAIAAHLLGVRQHELRNTDDALKLFERAEWVGREISDFRGLAITTTSHARAVRDLGELNRDRTLLERSIELFQSARVVLSEQASSDGLDVLNSLSRIDIGEAQAIFLLGDYERAIALGRLAVQRRHLRSDEEAWARIVLAGMLRDTNELGEARSVLAPALDDRDGRSDHISAVLFNVAASIARRADLDAEALKLARRSVEIGEQIGDSSHVAQALVTQALIQIDLLTWTDAINGPEVRAIRSMLYRARAIFYEGRNATGLSMVEDAFGRLP
ncbi:hypothetical protein [Agromyces sp. PvR057]|uniref:tetratricopeptide repeat protein n=1 Tax=Agromyces sp. PvR057 TaxID=3156403 RepID=UPI003391F3B8